MLHPVKVSIRKGSIRKKIFQELHKMVLKVFRKSITFLNIYNYDYYKLFIDSSLFGQHINWCYCPQRLIIISVSFSYFSIFVCFIIVWDISVIPAVHCTCVAW